MGHLSKMTLKTLFRPVGLIAIAALIVAPLTANAAGSATNTLSVTASVAQKCTIGAGTLAFGAYDPITTNLTAALDQQASMVVTCSKGASGVTVGFGASANAPAGCATPQRCLVSGGINYMNYQLYSDSGRTAVWTTAIAETVTGGVTTPTTLTIYGRIPGAQDVAAGASYADSVTATVNF